MALKSEILNEFFYLWARAPQKDLSLLALKWRQVTKQWQNLCYMGRFEHTAVAVSLNICAWLCPRKLMVPHANCHRSHGRWVTIKWYFENLYFATLQSTVRMNFKRLVNIWLTWKITRLNLSDHLSHTSRGWGVAVGGGESGILKTDRGTAV